MGSVTLILGLPMSPSSQLFTNDYLDNYILFDFQLTVQLSNCHFPSEFFHGWWSGVTKSFKAINAPILPLPGEKSERVGEEPSAHNVKLKLLRLQYYSGVFYWQ